VPSEAPSSAPRDSEAPSSAPGDKPSDDNGAVDYDPASVEPEKRRSPGSFMDFKTQEIVPVALLCLGSLFFLLTLCLVCKSGGGGARSASNNNDNGDGMELGKTSEFTNVNPMGSAKNLSQNDPIVEDEDEEISKPKARRVTLAEAADNNSNQTFWTECFDDDGNKYYFNSATQESKWA